VKQTRFVEVSYFGDNYVLAKCSDSVFYTLLDLDGNELSEEIHVVHRFQNGLLLTYNFFEKKYKSSDGISYVINYNVYKALNFDTGKSFVVNVIQSDNLLNSNENDFLKNKHWKVTVKEFLNKPIYCFKDFVFSELLDNQYLIVASYFDFNIAKASAEKGTGTTFNFDVHKYKRIWGVVDIYNCKEYNDETDINDKILSKLTFNEAEYELAELMELPEKPILEDYKEKAVFNDVAAEFVMYNNWKKKNRWKSMLSGILSLNIN
jgi:hypothetical protein